jgi:hypothetical protein
VRSQDLVLREEGPPAGTLTGWEWYASSVLSTGYFNDFKITLCQTGRAELVADFVANYDGRTPRKVYERAAQYTGNAVAYTWWGFDFDTPFEYDGVDNLIVEVFWLEREGGPGVVSYWTPMKGRCCMYAGPVPCDPAIFDYLHFMRITVSPTAVAPTSLGRVKAVFR